LYLPQIPSPVNRNLLKSLHVVRGSDSDILDKVNFLSKPAGAPFPPGVHEK
jgi:hypothetical protein